MICVGIVIGVDEEVPVPHCPISFLPNVKTDPAALTIRLWYSPHIILHIWVLLTVVTCVGTDKYVLLFVANKLPWPSCPHVFCPKVHAVPLFNNKTLWKAPVYILCTALIEFAGTVYGILTLTMLVLILLINEFPPPNWPKDPSP